MKGLCVWMGKRAVVEDGACLEVKDIPEVWREHSESNNIVSSPPHVLVLGREVEQERNSIYESPPKKMLYYLTNSYFFVGE